METMQKFEQEVKQAIAPAEKMGYSVKGVKTFQGMEGRGYNATLYRDNKAVALIIDDASGGGCRYEWKDFDIKNRVNVNRKTYDGSIHKYAGTAEEKLFVEACGGYEDCFAKRLVNDADSLKYWKRKLNSKIIIDDGGEIRHFNIKYGEKHDAEILKRYPEATILNKMPTEKAIAILRDKLEA